MKLPNQKLCAFLTFNGDAEEAMRFYESKLPDTKIDSLALFEKGMENGDEGKVLTGILSFAGQKILFMDMQYEYPAPAFSWATSLFINCADEAEFDTMFTGLSDGGDVMMGPEPVMYMRKCAWITDKFGVTWQLVWE